MQERGTASAKVFSNVKGVSRWTLSSPCSLCGFAGLACKGNLTACVA